MRTGAPSHDDGDGPDRRRYPRFAAPVRVALRGADGQWHWHDLRDVSAVGVALAGGPDLTIGNRIPMQVERVGGGSARVVRRAASNDPCLELEESDAPADLRHRRVAWLASDAPDHRRHKRVRPAPPAGRAIMVPVECPDGTQLEARLDDLSAGGLRLGALPTGTPHLAANTRILAGGVPGSVAWTGDGTLAVAFDKEVDVNRLKLKARSHAQ